MVGLAIIVRCHAYHLITFHLGDEGTTNTAIGTGCFNAVVGLAVVDNGFFHQRGSRARMNAGAAGNTFRLEEVFANSSRQFRVKATTFDRQRERTLDFVASAHATRANNALAGVE